MRTLPALLFPLVLACGGAEPKKTGAEAATPATAQPAAQDHDQTPAPPSTAEHMKDHFSKALKARDAVLAGDMLALKEPTTWIAEHEVDANLPEAWRPHVGDMQNAAKLGGQATDLSSAADAVAHMGAACGSCHRGMGKALDFTGKSPDGAESSALDHMKRHQWAAERLWEGLIGPSDVAWDAGIAALGEAPLHPEMLNDGKSPPPEVVALGKQVHELAAAGKDARDQASRAKVYAGFAATCSACHTALGLGK